MGHILFDTKKLIGRKGTTPDDRFADWAKQLFDSEGNPVEIVDFEKLYLMYGKGKWVHQQFAADGFYWLVFSSNTHSAIQQGLWLFRVSGEAVGHTVYSLGTLDKIIDAYNGSSYDGMTATVPEAVQDAARRLFTA